MRDVSKEICAEIHCLTSPGHGLTLFDEVRTFLEAWQPFSFSPCFSLRAC